MIPFIIQCGRNIVVSTPSKNMVIPNDLYQYVNSKLMENKKDVPCTDNNYKSKIRTARFVLTTDCNASCNGCYQKKQFSELLTCDHYIKALDILSGRFPDELNSIVYFGGEPLLKKEIFCDIANYVFLHYPQYNQTINTNGLLIDKQLIDVFIKKRVGVSLSVNSDFYSSFVDPEGVHSRIIKDLLSSGVSTSVNIVLDNDLFLNLLNLVKLLGNINKIYADNNPLKIALSYKIMSSTLCKDVQVGKYMSVFRRVIEHINNSGMTLSAGRLTLPYFKVIEGYAKHVCSVDGSEISIFPDGKIYACGYPLIQYGTLEDLDTEVFYQKIYKIVDTMKKEHLYKNCQDCHLRYICNSFCWVDAAYRKKMNEYPLTECVLMRNVFKILIDKIDF